MIDGHRPGDRRFAVFATVNVGVHATVFAAVAVYAIVAVAVGVIATAAVNVNVNVAGPV